MDATDIQIPRVKRGRRVIHENFDRKEYNKKYYENNKDKHTGDYHCTTCNVLCSFSNKTRHKRSQIHLDNLLKN